MIMLILRLDDDVIVRGDRSAAAAGVPGAAPAHLAAALALVHAVEPVRAHLDHRVARSCHTEYWG